MSTISPLIVWGFFSDFDSDFSCARAFIANRAAATIRAMLITRFMLVTFSGWAPGNRAAGAVDSRTAAAMREFGGTTGSGGQAIPHSRPGIARLDPPVTEGAPAQ